VGEFKVAINVEHQVFLTLKQKVSKGKRIFTVVGIGHESISKRQRLCLFVQESTHQPVEVFEIGLFVPLSQMSTITDQELQSIQQRYRSCISSFLTF